MTANKSPTSDTGETLTPDRGAAGLLALEIMHEVRNPLEAVNHVIYLTKNESEDPGKVQEYMQLAEEQLETLSRIVNQTLSFARATSEPRASDLSHLAEAALRIHHRAITAKGIHLVKEVPENLFAPIHTPEILQVVSNLILNALEALPTNGTLRVRLRRGPKHIHCLIADNGQGIPPNHIERIFEPFFTTKQDGGTGLGLALSRKIVERHGGRLSVRSSDRPGRTGTAFKVSLPA